MIQNQSNQNIICKASECSIAIYIKCAFEEDFKALIIDKNGSTPTTDELRIAFEKINLEYTDLAGLNDGDGLDLYKQVHRYSLRKDLIDTLLYVQYTSLTHFNEPHLEGLATFKEMGYKLTWINEEQFRKQLEGVKLKEIKNVVNLQKALSDLEDYRTKQAIKASGSEGNAKRHFKALIHRLQQKGYVINYDTTPIEDLGIMISEYNKENSQKVYN